MRSIQIIYSMFLALVLFAAVEIGTNKTGKFNARVESSIKNFIFLRRDLKKGGDHTPSGKKAITTNAKYLCRLSKNSALEIQVTRQSL